jgi:hypothetical protein
VTDLAETVLPSVWTLIRRSLLEEPGIERTNLVNRLTPRGLIRRTEAGATVDESRHVRPSLNALMDMGIVEDRGEGRLYLIDGAESEPAFRKEITRRIFALPPDENDAWRLRTELQYEHHAELALAWLHLQGVGTPIVGFAAAEQRLQRQLGAERRLLRDTAPYNTLERLVRWCGVAADVDAPDEGGTPTGLIPDPTDALRAELDSLLPPVGDESARAVVERAGEVFAWLPNGSLGRAVARELAECPDDADATGAVSEGLSLALVQLHHEQEIELIAGDDAAERVSLTPGGFVGATGVEVRAVARIRRLQGTHD